MSDGKTIALSATSKICEISDELHDCWLLQHPKEEMSEMLSLSASQFRMVGAVHRMTKERPEGIMLKELAEKLSLSSSAVSVMVDGMVRRGFFERVTSSDDRRKVNICISAKGWERIRVCEDFWSEICREFFDGLDPEDCSKFIEMLKNFYVFISKKSEGMVK